MLKSIDTFNEIIEMKRKLTNEDTDILELWKDYISEYPEIKEQCLEDASNYDFDREIKPVILQALTSDFNKLETAHTNFIKFINNLNDNFQHTFLINDDIYIYFYVGLCNGAGWATHVNYYQTVLIGAEKVVELNWHEEEQMIPLIYHELSHVAHSILRNETLDIHFKTQREKSIWQLYIEGFAQRYEQVLYIEGFYHQDKNDWLKWCENNHDEICREYLHRIKKNINTQCFFGDWVNFRGHSDVGYYLGCQFIKNIRNNYSIKELGNIKMSELEVLLTNYLEKY